MDGYYYGILDVYYAMMKTDDSAAAAPTYDVPKVLGKSIEVTVTPNYREGSLYASNAKVRDVKKIDSYSVKVNADKIAADVQSEVLGRTTDANGVQMIKGTNEPPKIAIGFALTLDNGEKELWWMYKGQLSEPSLTGKTDSDKLEYQTPSLEGNFVRRIYDDALAAVAETGVEGVKVTAESWFKTVYNGSVTA